MDKVYFWYSQPNESHSQSQCTYSLNRELSFVMHENDADYFDVIEDMMCELFKEVQNNDEALPKVAVIILASNGDFDIKFDYKDCDALNVSIMALGYPNSIFQSDEIDIPSDVLDFQQELEKV